MKNYGIFAIIFYLCAVASYILAVINIFDSKQGSMGITWFCVGSMWMCLGSIYLNKSYKSKNEDDDLDKDDK